ncbi:MAG TPA: hypothetical protein VGE27_05330 [Gemmatimonas sp.]|uniref:hypothetical protein n=1 Tax=Gemmatimonas sp. TaxID=1962908 RepID=UPI002ED7BA06
MTQQQGRAEQTVDAAELQREIEQAVRAATNAARDARIAQSDADAARADAVAARRQPGTIVFPSNGPDPDITVKVDGRGIHVQQGDASTIVPIRDVVPDGLVKISWAFAAAVGFLCIGLPIARAIARYIDRRGSAAAQESTLRRQFESRFENMERNLDTVAVEMEKVSEAQRFTTRVLTERGEQVPVSSHTSR